MTSEKNVLSELLKRREENISESLKWSIDDINEMIGTYRMALRIANDYDKLNSVAVLTEKIDQLEVVLAQKSKSPESPEAEV